MIPSDQTPKNKYTVRRAIRRIAWRLSAAVLVFSTVAMVGWFHPSLLFGGGSPTQSEADNIPSHAENYYEPGTTPDCEGSPFPFEVREKFLDWTKLDVKHPGTSDRLHFELTDIVTTLRDTHRQKEICRGVLVITSNEGKKPPLRYPVIYTFDDGDITAEFSDEEGSTR